MLKTRLTLTPGANDTKKLVEHYGNRLVCVRYRYDAEQRRRIKTVELIEEESAWMPSGAIYLVQIGYGETAVREKGQRSRGAMEQRAKAVDHEWRGRPPTERSGSRRGLAGAGDVDIYG